MCATCVSQGVLYVGGAVGTLRIMAHRAARRRTELVASSADAAVPRNSGHTTTG
ncbi:MAG: hypothetical protein U5K30_07205 [Acidimicrobiales bacterium]|nr:hypothetical protein [Acidimicrobiales bacterium]